MPLACLRRDSLYTDRARRQLHFSGDMVIILRRHVRHMREH